MPSDLPRFTIRTKQENIDKMKYIAEIECRSTSKEIEYLMLKRIREYEKKFGEITLSQKDNKKVSKDSLL